MLPGAQKNEVLVIGGGPAGATAATLLAQQGVGVTLMEREKGPRFHIGESLMPETYWTLRRLGVLDQLKASAFVKKYSVQFVTDSGKESQPFYFFENNPHEASQTWQVLRSEFDTMLLDNAAAHGVDVRYDCRVLEPRMDADQCLGVRFQEKGNEPREFSSRVVVDASGQSLVMGNRLKLKVPDPLLRKGSVWAYFEGALREPGLDEGATLVLQTQGKKGWFWYIPMHNNRVSVGVVSSMDSLFGGGFSHQEIFNRELEACPAAMKRVAPAKRVTDFYATRDFSYTCSQVAGNGWVLAGDALGFLDPIYSSGVFLALKSGELAADAIARSLAKNDLSERSLGNWGPDFLKGMERMKRLVYAFYEGFSFGAFIRKHPEMKRHIIDLLVGDLFKESVDAVIGPMDAMRQEMKQMAVG
ncbi:MAG: NAD(P)/FAD-dependent oxidoreductase [Gemmataceae bacterium]|nr:NAD(P)/FAD-dependent oxidoreductase [Gemmataceae bacterium]